MKEFLDYILILISIAIFIHSLGYLPLKITYFTISSLTGFILLLIGLNRIVKRLRVYEDRDTYR
ncbi:MAG TPA: hypothetical protein EYH44_05185 [Thermoprotei archaeon]|nr:hypothetical protein [Thermoprotei archaeon]